MVNLQLDNKMVKMECSFVTRVGQIKSEPPTGFEHKQ